jgi:futalosine hydrolase
VIPPLLVATAVDAERHAIRAGLPADRARPPAVVTVGVGPAAAAAATARVLALAEAAGRPYRTVVCAGIAGGFAGRAPVGALVLAARSVHADLGAEAAGGFLTLDELGFGGTAVPADPVALAALRGRLPAAMVGDVLTVATATGTAARAAALAARYPAAVAEAMEGYGVACAAAASGVAFAELRAVCNVVGPRDTANWEIPRALGVLTTAAAALTG